MLLPILHQVQASLDFIPTTAVPQIVHALNLSTAQVRSVLSFYPFFRTEPLPSTHQVQLCVAEACQARGALNLKVQCDGLVQSLGENELSVEPIYCLGQCATGPAAMWMATEGAFDDRSGAVGWMRRRHHENSLYSDGLGGFGLGCG